MSIDPLSRLFQGGNRKTGSGMGLTKLLCLGPEAAIVPGARGSCWSRMSWRAGQTIAKWYTLSGSVLQSLQRGEMLTLNLAASASKPSQFINSRTLKLDLCSICLSPLDTIQCGKMRPLVMDLGAHLEIGIDPHWDVRSAYSLAASISFIEFFHESLEQGKAISRSGSAYSSRVRAHECIMLDCPWSASLLRRTVRASELGLRHSIEKTKLSFLLTIALFTGTVPSRQLRAVDGHL